MKLWSERFQLGPTQWEGAYVIDASSSTSMLTDYCYNDSTFLWASLYLKHAFFLENRTSILVHYNNSYAKWLKEKLLQPSPAGLLPRPMSMRLLKEMSMWVLQALAFGIYWRYGSSRHRKLCSWGVCMSGADFVPALSRPKCWPRLIFIHRALGRAKLLTIPSTSTVSLLWHLVSIQLMG